MVARLEGAHTQSRIKSATFIKEDAMYYGQFDPPVDRFIHDRYFSDSPRNGVLIECGAYDGNLESSCKFFEESLGWRAINVEPSPDIYKKLVMNRPGSLNIQAALTNEDKPVSFTDVHFPGRELLGHGSMKHLDFHKELLDNEGCRYEIQTVPGTTYASLIRNLNLPRVDLMVLDIEGCELIALEGFRDAAVLPSVLCVEHGHLGVDAIRQAVEPLGFVFDTTSFVNSFFVHRGLASRVVELSRRGESSQWRKLASRVAKMNGRVESSAWRKLKSLFGRRKTAA